MVDIKEAIEKSSKNYGNPLSSYRIVYDAPQNQLEPVYYWLLDFVSGMGFKVEKIVDNFMSSPGSGHFSDMSQKATIMQQQGTKLAADLHQIVKSTINILYDLREFEQRLKHYEDAFSDDPKIKESGLMALKSIWLDQVDLVKRGRGSIHQMSADLGYVTLRDAFMIANSIDDIEKMTIKNEDENEGGKYSGTINEAVARVLIPRVSEFNDWKKRSYDELTKRFNIEKNYLKSQVETIKLYSAWMKPYFKAAAQLKQQGFDNNAALVNAFSTSMFELTLLGISKVKPESIDQIKSKPNKWGQLRGYNLKREYNSIVLINIIYRGHLMKVDQKGNHGAMFSGKVEMNFDSYALNSEEMSLFRKELEKDDLSQSLEALDIAESARKEMEEDFEYFLKSDEEKEKEKKKKKTEKNKSNDINPFSALLSPFMKKKEGIGKSDKKEINSATDISTDNWVEKHLRAEASNSASSRLYTIYDVYKKSHRMPSSSINFDNYSEEEVSPKVNTFKEAVKGPGEKIEKKD